MVFLAVFYIFFTAMIRYVVRYVLLEFLLVLFKCLKVAFTISKLCYSLFFPRILFKLAIYLGK
jgi:hypothetical protein